MTPKRIPMTFAVATTGVVVSEAARCHYSGKRAIATAKAATAAKTSKASKSGGPKVVNMPKPNPLILHLNYIKLSMPKRLEIW